MPKPVIAEEQAGDEEVAPVAFVLEGTPEEAKDEGQHVEPVIRLVVLVDAVGHLALVAVEIVIDEGDAGDEIAVPYVPKPWRSFCLPE